MEGKEIKTSPAMIEDNQIAIVQPPARAQASDILSLEKEMGRNPLNFPTKIEDLTYVEDSKSEAKMKGTQDNEEDSLNESKIEDLENRVESLLAVKTLLESQALCHHLTNEMLEEENARLRAINEAYLRLREEKDAELQAMIQTRKRLEDSIAYWSRVLSWIPKSP